MDYVDSSIDGCPKHVTRAPPTRGLCLGGGEPVAKLYPESRDWVRISPAIATMGFSTTFPVRRQESLAFG